MVDKLDYHENLTDSPEQAGVLWRLIKRGIILADKKEILDDPNLTILDIGGGIGEFSTYVNSQGIHCTSLDLRNYGVDPKANPVTGDAHKMLFADASFSIVLANGVFDPSQYSQNYHLLLKEVARVLKKSGIFAIICNPDDLPHKEVEKYFQPLNLSLILWEKK